ncbi:MAG: hypothetical protein ACE5LX_07725 [Nitrospinota bacterium]
MFPDITLEMWSSSTFALPYWAGLVILAFTAVGAIVLLGYARVSGRRAEEAEKKEAAHRRAA